MPSRDCLAGNFVRWCGTIHGPETRRQVEEKERHRPFLHHQIENVRPLEVAGSTLPSGAERSGPERPREGPDGGEPSPESLASQPPHGHPDRRDLHLRWPRDDRPWCAKRKVAPCAPRPIRGLVRYRVGSGRRRGAASWGAAPAEPVGQGIAGGNTTNPQNVKFTPAVMGMLPIPSASLYGERALSGSPVACTRVSRKKETFGAILNSTPPPMSKNAVVVLFQY